MGQEDTGTHTHTQLHFFQEERKLPFRSSLWGRRPGNLEMGRGKGGRDLLLHLPALVTVSQACRFRPGTPTPAHPLPACGEEGRQQRKGPQPARTRRTQPATAGLPKDTHAGRVPARGRCHTRWIRKGSHTHTPDPAHTRCHAEPDTRGGKALRGPRCTGWVDDRMPARPSGPGPRSAGARPQAPQTPAGVPAARRRRGGKLGLGSGRNFRPGPAPPLSAGLRQPPGRPNRGLVAPPAVGTTRARAGRPGASGWMVASTLPGSPVASDTLPERPRGRAGGCRRAGARKPGQSPAAAACPARPARTPTRPRAGAASSFDRAGDRGGAHSRDAGKPGWDLDSGACEWGSPNPAGHLWVVLVSSRHCLPLPAPALL